jgi:hypothetical protein
VRELAVALALIAAVTLLSVLVTAPLGPAANPGMSPNPAKAPWYFVGFQELLLHLHPLFAVVVLPALGTLGFVLLPYLHRDDRAAGVFMVSRRGRRLAALAAVVALTATPLLIVLDDLWLAGGGVAPSPLLRGLLPTLVLVGGFFGFYAGLRRFGSARRDEALQACFVLAVVGFLVLTATGVWFRGAGMALVWPWQS